MEHHENIARDSVNGCDLDATGLCRNDRRMQRIDYTGRIFGQLTGIRYDRTEKGDAIWLWRCACGTEKSIAAKRVKTLQIKSCGCLRRLARFPVIVKHGDARGGKISRLHIVWQGIKQRCLNPRNSRYRWYGALGVSIDPAWLDYASFRAWAIEAGYQQDLVIDRIDPSGNYTSGNCRWITADENNRRTRRWGTVTQPRPRKHREHYDRAANGKFIAAS